MKTFTSATTIPLKIKGREISVSFFESVPGYETVMASPKDVFKFEITDAIISFIKKTFKKHQKNYTGDIDHIEVHVTEGFEIIPTDIGNLKYNSKIEFWTLSEILPDSNTLALYLGH